MRAWWIVGCLSLTAWADPAGERLLDSEASVGIVAEGVANAAGASRWGDGFLGPAVSGRWQWRGLLLDGAVLVAWPLETNAAVSSLTFNARLGFSGERWAVLAGVVLQDAASTPAPIQLLPSLHGQVAFGGWGLSAGLFEDFGITPFHVSFEARDWGVGYVPLIGARAHLDWRLVGPWGVRATAFAFALGVTQVGFVSLSALWLGGAR